MKTIFLALMHSLFLRCYKNKKKNEKENKNNVTEHNDKILIMENRCLESKGALSLCIQLLLSTKTINNCQNSFL